MNTATKIFTRLVLLFTVALLSGCYGYTRFYPVQGPLATQTPVPVLTAKLGLPAKFFFAPALRTYSGNISLALPDGEICKGRWDEVTTPPVNPLQSEWDSIYGKGFYLSHVLGTHQYAQATLRGTRGTVITVQMYAPETEEEPGKVESGPLRGVAKDNQGNLYKVEQY